LENVEDEANKVVELKLNIPGNQLFAKAQAKSFEEATDIAVESLRRQVNKYKTKNRTNASNHKDVLAVDEEEF
jgi:putative sigma-54 modulation protein